MNQFVSGIAALSLFLSMFSLSAIAQASRLIANWTFNESAGQITHDQVSGIGDPIAGFYKHVDGISGKALRFDGYTTSITRSAATAPRPVHGLTVEAWVAVNAYPWNWVPVVDQRREQQAGYFFGIDSFGRIGLQVAVNGGWWSLFSQTKLPLRKWCHIAGTYDPATGMTIYLDGKSVGQLSLHGPLTLAVGQDLLIGRVRHPILPAQWIHPKYPVWYSFDGILDDVRIYDGNLTDAEIHRQYSQIDVPTGDALPWDVLPSGPPGVGRFGAYYTTLHFDELWEKPRRVGPDSDVVVRFDQMPTRLVFWQGTNYSGDWVTENGKWYTDEFLETGGQKACPGGEDCEPMSDKHNRYSHVRIIENNDARTVVHWRYALCEVEHYTCANPDPLTGWTDWADEYFTVYPDGVAVRKQVLWTSNFNVWHEFQETIVINGPGQRPEDNLNVNALTIGNMKGETVTYSWLPKPPTKIDGPAHPNIQVVNLKSTWKPFQIVSPVHSSFDVYSGEQTYSTFEWWNHWPVAQVASSGISAVAPDRASHSSLSHIYWDPYAKTQDSMTKIMLVGLTTKSAAELVPLAKSWLSPPEFSINGAGFKSQGYDPTQRTFVIVRQPGNSNSRFSLLLNASSCIPAAQSGLSHQGLG